MNKEELEEFYKNANEEELLKHEAELMSHGNISSANLSTCETYGLSGNCGSKCPKFKNKTCEVYEEVLEKETTNLKQALIDIREECKNTSMTVAEYKELFKKIDKVIGDEKSDR